MDNANEDIIIYKTKEMKPLQIVTLSNLRQKMEKWEMQMFWIHKEYYVLLNQYQIILKKYENDVRFLKQF